MRTRKASRAAAAWRTLTEAGANAVVRAVAAAAAAIALAMCGLAVVTLPVRTPALLFVALAVVVCYSAFRVWRAHGTEPPSGTLALLLVLCAFFAVGLPATELRTATRLAHVALVALGIALVISAVLHWRWKVGPRAALITAIVLVAEVVVIEFLVGSTHDGTVAAMTPRADWPGLRRRADIMTTDSSGSRRLAWSDSASLDDELGMRFAADAKLRTLYPDNPRGYFIAGDFRPDIWTLGVADGSRAQLAFPDQPGHLRVAIAAARRGVPEWHIGLDQAGLAVRGSQTHRLQFRARADRARPAVVAVTQGAGEFALLGLVDTLPLTPEWQTFRLYFTPPIDERNARIHFALGGHEPSVDLADVDLHNETAGAQVTPYQARGRWVVDYRFNAVGCRGDVAPNPRPNETRVLLLGDGVTMGVGVHEKDVLSTRLEAALNSDTLRPGPPTRVMNCGVPGYGTWEAQRFYERLRTFQPAVVALLVGPDADRHHWEEAQRAGRDRAHSRAEQVFSTWATIRRLRMTRRAHDYQSSVSDVLRLQELVTQQGGRLVVVLARTSDSGQWARLRAALTDGLGASAVTLVDTDDTLAEGRRWHQLAAHDTDPHPDERVHAALANFLAKAIAPLLTRADPVAPSGR